MSRFLDVRLTAVGGNLAASVAVYQGTSITDYTGLAVSQLVNDVNGRHVLLGTHGFNVNRADGIAALSNWERLLQLPDPSVFVGILWPGDSTWAHGLDYPDEPRIANDAGNLLAPFIDANFAGAASISFASHSLGARLVLQTVTKMSHPVRRTIMMAGAIDDNCLDTEFQQAAGKIGTISVLASHKDDVLSMAFPLGNLLGGILTKGHPWWHGALGRSGPASPLPGNFASPFEIPDNWDYGHGNYLQIDPASPQLALPVIVPPNGTGEPANGAAGWQEAFSATFVSTRFR